ncbi:peptide methionine sulfoxide reductase MsrA, partial [Baffinella frigidus]
EKATFAAGCFWSVELAFQRLPGVSKTQVGYIAGTTPSPTYEQVSSGSSGHTEAVEIQFDPASLSYRDLVQVFFEIHDPTTLNRQGNDRGTQYRSGIYTHSEEQAKQANTQKALGKTVATEIKPATTFYAAEAYHQQYLAKGGQCSRTGTKDNIKCYG